MHIRFRRALYLFFIALFVLISAVTIGYARGYRYDTQSHTVKRTGLIVLNSEPDDASVWVNGNKSSEKTLAYLKNLRPGTYGIRVEKEGFFPWTKKLLVNEGSATIADTITLFQSNPVSEAVVPLGSQFVFHPFAPSIVYVKDEDEKQIRRYHTGSESDILLYTTRDEIESLEYSVSGTNLLVRLVKNGKKNSIVIPLDAPQEAFSVNSLIDRTVMDVSWSLDSDDLLMLTIDEGTLALTLSTRRVSPVVPDSEKPRTRYLTSVGFLEYGDSTLLLITNDGRRDILFSNLADDMIIRGHSSGHLAISNPTQSTVFLLKDLSKAPIRIEEISILAREMTWDERGNEIIFANNAEIQIYSLQNQKVETLGRYSEPFSDVRFFPNSALVVFKRDNGDLYAIERDGRDHRNAFRLANMTLDYAFSQNGKRLYLSLVTPVGDGHLSLKRLEIQ